MKQWWYEFLRLPFAGGRLFSRDPWRLIWAIRQISRLSGKRVTFFGGRDAYLEGKYRIWAAELARLCVQAGMSVMTGGGPGVMEAANCGAQEAAHQRADTRLWTLGISVEGVDIDFQNRCAPLVSVPFFFMRKWLLLYYCHGIVVFPGGIGTLDELFEALNLIKTGKMRPLPIILIDTRYWQSLLDWYAQAVAHELIKAEYKDMMYVVDDMHQALERLREGMIRHR